MSNNSIEIHPLPPFLPANASHLMLGSFPPPRQRWKMNFYYPNLQNDMWRIFGLIFFNNPSHFFTTNSKGYNEPLLRQFLSHEGIAISDTAYQVKRLQNNAADKHLEVIQAFSLSELLAQLPACHHIVTTGEKATEILLSQLPSNTLAPKIGIPSQAQFTARTLTLHRLPSSSRAYPLPLVEKAKYYQACFCP